MKRGFLSQKGNGGGRGVKEKHFSMADKERSGVEPSANKDGVAPSVTDVDATPPVDSVAKKLIGCSMDGLDSMLENGSWFIRNNPLILKKWHPDVNLLKEDVVTIPVWVKLHGVPVAAFSEDGLSAIATKLANAELKDNIVAAMPKITGEGYYTCNIRVEYEWKPPRCAYCKVFGHVQEECIKNIGTSETKNLKKTSQNPKGISVGQKMGFKPTKQVFQPVSKKPTANPSVNRKKNVEPTKEVSKSNPFEVLTSVDNDEELGTNGGTSNLASQATNSSGSSFCTVDARSPSSTPIDKIDKIKKLIAEGKANLVDNICKTLEKIASSCEYDSEDEVALVDNEMASFLAKKDGYVIGMDQANGKAHYGPHVAGLKREGGEQRMDVGGLLERAIVEALSHMTRAGVGTITLRSCRRHFSHEISQVLSAKALYSASVEDLETIIFFLDCQEMRL
ncbi:putative reverse transcriptase domain-containing protein [Tanacetum coccineum]